MAKIGMIAGLIAGAVLGACAAYFAPMVSSHFAESSRPYAGQQERRVSSLSAEDIAALEKGEGWGLAKPAELNGYPGPAHVLEFADKLDLEPDQKMAIQRSFDAMNAKARELGSLLIEAEAALDGVFESRQATPELLAERLKLTESIRAALRQVHLAAHLEITPLLTDDQKKQYAALRGYGSGHDGHAGH